MLSILSKSSKFIRLKTYKKIQHQNTPLKNLQLWILKTSKIPHFFSLHLIFWHLNHLLWLFYLSFSKNLFCLLFSKSRFIILISILRSYIKLVNKDEFKSGSSLAFLDIIIFCFLYLIDFIFLKYMLLKYYLDLFFGYEGILTKFS